MAGLMGVGGIASNLKAGSGQWPAYCNGAIMSNNLQGVEHGINN